MLPKLSSTPKTDLFTSRLNCQIGSYRPDSQSSVVNTFTLIWRNLDFYAFPPFAIIPRVIQKIVKDRANFYSITIYPRTDLLQ